MAMGTLSTQGVYLATVAATAALGFWSMLLVWLIAWVERQRFWESVVVDYMRAGNQDRPSLKECEAVFRTQRLTYAHILAWETRGRVTDLEKEHGAMQDRFVGYAKVAGVAVLLLVPFLAAAATFAETVVRTLAVTTAAFGAGLAAAFVARGVLIVLSPTRHNPLTKAREAYLQARH